MLELEQFQAVEGGHLKAQHADTPCQVAACVAALAVVAAAAALCSAAACELELVDNAAAVAAAAVLSGPAAPSHLLTFVLEHVERQKWTCARRASYRSLGVATL